MGENYISGYEIFDYWKDKTDLFGNEIISWWDIRSCFACGLQDGTKEDDEDLKTFWNKKTKLEKAHIKAKSLGGTYEPYNMIFLCKKCHAESPDTIHRESFMTWLTGIKSSTFFGFNYKNFLNVLNASFEVHNKNQKYDFLELNLEKSLSLLHDAGGIDKFNDYIKDSFTTHGATISKSTFPMLFFSFVENYQKEKFDVLLKDLHFDEFKTEQNKDTK